MTNTFEEITVRQKSSAVDGEEMESEFSEAERTALMAYKLNGESTTQSSECEERQRLRTEEAVPSRDYVKLFNDNDTLEIVSSKTVKLSQQEQVQNSTVEHFVALAVARLRP